MAVFTCCCCVGRVFLARDWDRRDSWRSTRGRKDLPEDVARVDGAIERRVAEDTDETLIGEAIGGGHHIEVIRCRTTRYREVVSGVVVVAATDVAGRH